MSGDVPDFNNMETRPVVKDFFLQGKAPIEIHAILTETGEHAPLYATVKNWESNPNVVNFSPSLRFVLDDTKQWPPLRLLNKFTS